MAEKAGIEPAYPGVKVPCLNQLGYFSIGAKGPQSFAPHKKEGVAWNMPG